MDGGALGGSAVTTMLAQEVLTLEETTGTLAWVAHEIRLGSGEGLEHTHEFAFVHAATEPHLLTTAGGSVRLEPSQGTAVRSGTTHRHEAPDSPSVFWEIRLAAPGSLPPSNVPNARLVFESSLLEDIPRMPLAAFVHVLVPSGAETSVHTHPGPEFIYQTVGQIEYENGLIGTREMGPGEIEGIPPLTAVQKRNVFADDRAALRNRIQELASVEGAAEFGSQLKLLNQAVVNYLDICDSPQKCEEYLTKVMVQIEELEGKFSEFDEFLEQLAETRDEVYGAFDSRRVALVEKRGRRAAALGKSAERILHGLKNRVDKIESIDEINGFFASDLLVEKVRDIARQLGDMEESIRVDDIQGQLKTIREDAVRQLKDRQDLYGDGGQTIQLGRHRFSVNVQDLSGSPRWFAGF